MQSPEGSGHDQQPDKTPQENEAGQPGRGRGARARASPETRLRLHASARTIGNLSRAGVGPGDPRRDGAEASLLGAARAWRVSAMANQERAGLPDARRPSFTAPPEPADPESPPGQKEYMHNLHFWASMYAWNLADREDASRAGAELTMTASVGAARDREPMDPGPMDRVFRAARAVKNLSRSEVKPERAELARAAEELLQAAREFRQARVRRARDLELPKPGPPSHRNEPGPLESGKPIPRREYAARVRYWTRLYAWQAARGLDTARAAGQLVRTAQVGPEPLPPGPEDGGNAAPAAGNAERRTRGRERRTRGREIE